MILGEDPKHDPLISRIITFNLVCPISMSARPQEKTHHWNFGACIFGVLSIFVTCSLVCPISMPAARRRPQKKHTPGILEHVPFVFCRFLLFLVSGIVIWLLFGRYLLVLGQML